MDLESWMGVWRGKAPAWFWRGLLVCGGLWLSAVSGCVADGGGEEAEVAVVEAGDGIAE